MKFREMPSPDWRVWKHVAKLAAEEAAALTMNFCPNTIKKILGEVSESGSPCLFGLVASTHGMKFEDAHDFENRLLVLDRGYKTGVATADLATLAKRLNWSIPDELDNLATPAAKPTTQPETPVMTEAKPQPADETLSDNERTKLLKHFGGLALLLAEKSSVYRKGEMRPNADQIAQGVVDHITSLPGRKGAGKSSLRDSIKAGVDLLNT